MSQWAVVLLNESRYVFKEDEKLNRVFKVRTSQPLYVDTVVGDRHGIIYSFLLSRISWPLGVIQNGPVYFLAILAPDWAAPGVKTGHLYGECISREFSLNKVPVVKGVIFQNRSASTPTRSLSQAMGKLSIESSPTAPKKVSGYD